MARTDEIKETWERFQGMLLSKEERTALDTIIRGMERNNALASFQGDPEIGILLLVVLQMKSRLDEMEHNGAVRCRGLD